MNEKLRFAIALIAMLYFSLPLSAAAATSITPASLTTLTNTDRIVNGVGPVTEDLRLDAAAQKKANDMMAHGYFAHTSPVGIDSWYWFKSAGYYYLHAGENLAMDFTGPQTLETAWMNSPAHRGNIVKGVYTRVGFGIAQGMYLGKQTTFVVEFFATPPQLATKDSVLASNTTRS